MGRPPILSAMNWILDGFDKDGYIHVLINHLPVTGLFVGLVFLLLALLFRSRGAILLALAMITLLCASAWPVYYYGEQAYDIILSQRYHDGSEWLKLHKQLAETWVTLFYVTGGVSLLGLILGSFSSRSLRYTVPLVILLSVGSLVAGAFISDAGGKATHEEFREGPPPRSATPEEENKKEDSMETEGTEDDTDSSPESPEEGADGESRPSETQGEGDEGSVEDEEPSSPKGDSSGSSEEAAVQNFSLPCSRSGGAIEPSVVV